MYIFKNAVKNLLRNKARNLILAAVILMMLTAASVYLIINTSITKKIQEYKTRFESEVYIQTDIEKFKEMLKVNQGKTQVLDIKDEEKLLYADSEYLKATNWTAVYPGYSEKLKGLAQAENSSEGNAAYNPEENSEYYHTNVQVVGHSNFASLPEVHAGLRKMIEGELYKTQYECIISKDFAELNGLKPGEEIEVRNGEINNLSAPLKLTVTGIFADFTSSRSGEWVSAANNPRNEILTSYDTMKNYKETIAKGKQIFSLSPVYILKNPDMLADFNKEVHQKGLRDIYVMQTNESTYHDVVKPLEGASRTVGVITLIVFLAGSLIYVLLAWLAIRERKYEIGVLRAMGMKKEKVALGIVYESILMIALCLMIGLPAGAAAAQPVTNALLDNQMQRTEEYKEKSLNGDTGTMPAQMEASLSLTAVAKVSAAAVVIAILSCSVGVIYIIRYEPMINFSERK